MPLDYSCGFSLEAKLKMHFFSPSGHPPSFRPPSSCVWKKPCIVEKVWGTKSWELDSIRPFIARIKEKILTNAHCMLLCILDDLTFLIYLYGSTSVTVNKPKTTRGVVLYDCNRSSNARELSLSQKKIPMQTRQTATAKILLWLTAFNLFPQTWIYKFRIRCKE